MFQDSIIDTLSESIPKVKAMRRDPGKFKRNVGKVVVFLQTLEYDDINDRPSYEARRLLTGSLDVKCNCN